MITWGILTLEVINFEYFCRLIALSYVLLVPFVRFGMASWVRANGVEYSDMVIQLRCFA